MVLGILKKLPDESLNNSIIKRIKMGKHTR